MSILLIGSILLPVISSEAMATYQEQTAINIGQVLIDHQFAKTCEKKINNAGGEVVSNQEECLKMLTKLELSLIKSENCPGSEQCARMLDHIRNLKSSVY